MSLPFGCDTRDPFCAGRGMPASSRHKIPVYLRLVTSGVEPSDHLLHLELVDYG